MKLKACTSIDAAHAEVQALLSHILSPSPCKALPDVPATGALSLLADVFRKARVSLLVSQELHSLQVSP